MSDLRTYEPCSYVFTFDPRACVHTCGLQRSLRQYRSSQNLHSLMGRPVEEFDAVQLCVGQHAHPCKRRSPVDNSCTLVHLCSGQHRLYEKDGFLCTAIHAVVGSTLCQNPSCTNVQSCLGQHALSWKICLVLYHNTFSSVASGTLCQDTSCTIVRLCVGQHALSCESFRVGQHTHLCKRGSLCTSVQLSVG